MRTHLKPTEAFLTTCLPRGAKKGFVKGEALRLLRTNSSNKTFGENITTFQKHHMETGYLENLINNTFSEVKFQERTKALLKQNKAKKRVLPIITRYHPAVPNLNEILKKMRYLLQQQTLLNQIFKEPPIIQEGAFT